MEGGHHGARQYPPARESKERRKKLRNGTRRYPPLLKHPGSELTCKQHTYLHAAFNTHLEFQHLTSTASPAFASPSPRIPRHPHRPPPLSHVSSQPTVLHRRDGPVPCAAAAPVARACPGCSASEAGAGLVGLESCAHNITAADIGSQNKTKTYNTVQPGMTLCRSILCRPVT
jgi:hypothetical protein